MSSLPSKPLAGKTFYLDLEGYAIMKELASDLQSLGGKQETVLTKTVDFVVSNKVSKQLTNNGKGFPAKKKCCQSPVLPKNDSLKTTSQSDGYQRPPLIYSSFLYDTHEKLPKFRIHKGIIHFNNNRYGIRRVIQVADKNETQKQEKRWCALVSKLSNFHQTGSQLYSVMNAINSPACQINAINSPACQINSSSCVLGSEQTLSMKSRGKIMLETARNKKNKKLIDTANIIKFCKTWNIIVYSVEKAVPAVKKYKSMCNGSFIVEQNKCSLMKEVKNTDEITSIYSPFIKIEDKNFLYKTIYKTFLNGKCPKLLLNSDELKKLCENNMANDETASQMKNEDKNTFHTFTKKEENKEKKKQNAKLHDYK